MQAIGSDGDEATMKAIAVSFTSESFVNLLCASHKKENIEYRLKEMKSATPAISHIVSDIFGTNVDSILYQKGLIDSETTSEFDSRIRDMKTTWDHLVPTFQAWFVSNDSEKFKSHLTKAVNDQTQLDGHFSNNRVESTNNNVKDLVGRSGKVEEYVTCQQQEFEMAMYANGPYDLASTYTYLRKERHIWNGLNAEERKKVIKQFWKSNVQGRKLLDKFLLINEHAENRSKSDHSLPKPETRPNVSSKREISYDDYQLQIPGISEDLLKEMFEKAEGLLQSQDSILKTPGFEGVYVRHSLRQRPLNPIWSRQ
ncbi:MAD2 [Mytilus coruscus]|uniref:MAD2 n=1 Tax=Mytilus coruscus TaxID=42192 RepID=A0A6J8ESS2_MYTCO|nr:MAD2 [Mytilus coruscus]